MKICYGQLLDQPFRRKTYIVFLLIQLPYLFGYKMGVSPLQNDYK